MKIRKEALKVFEVVETKREVLRTLSEFEGLIEKQLNVKELKIIKGEKNIVEFDSVLTPELEQEGYAREVMRRVQMF